VERLFPELVGRAGLVRLEYRSSLGEEATEARFLEDLAARRREEMRRGQTLVGPHRDDLMIELDGRDMRTYGSRGQQRLLALALRLAETGPVRDAVGSPPILLLDDALSELDPGVQANVLRAIQGAGQVFLTTADEASPAAYARRWEVRGGSVTDLRLEPVRGAA
jgi:DNA replication and repair protein RecF